MPTISEVVALIGACIEQQSFVEYRSSAESDFAIVGSMKSNRF